MTVEEARAALDRRAAVAVLAGAVLGRLPLLWLIREALDDYDDASQGLAKNAKEEWIAPLTFPREARLLTAGGHEFWLSAYEKHGILVERDDLGSTVRSHEVPNGALVLYDVVKDDPVRAENLLLAIESATEDRPQ